MNDQRKVPTVRDHHPLAWPRLQQHGRLAIGVGGTVGGVILLASNLLPLVSAGGATVPWVSLVANTALIFGGAMFLREHRRRAHGQD